MTIIQAPVQGPVSASAQQKGRNFKEYKVGFAGGAIMVISFLFGYGVDPGNNLANLMMLAGSLIVLLAASNIVLEFAVKLAEAAGVSELIIGLTIVSIGTSIPEMFTAVISAGNGVGAFVIGDIYGSYITQLTLFLGIVIIWAPRTVSKWFVPNVKRDGGLMLLALCLLSFNIVDGSLTYLESTISVAIFVIYTVLLYLSSKRDPNKKTLQINTTESMEEFEGVHTRKEIAEIIETKVATGQMDMVPLRLKKSPRLIATYIAMVLAGTFFCFIGAHWMVESGVNIARSMIVPEHVIAATIVGFGTGMPEFVVSFVAVKRRRYTIAYGNLLGSNVVDPLLSISLGVFTRPILLGTEAAFQIIATMLPVAILVDLFIIGIFSRKASTRKSGRFFGVVLMAFYAAFFVISLVFRG
nr:sodium:calcium antiporter [Candidatus Sigynarchaeota archaeon]